MREIYKSSLVKAKMSRKTPHSKSATLKTVIDLKFCMNLDLEA